MVNKLSQRGPLASPIDRPVDRYPLTKSHYITQSPDNMKVSPVLLIVLLSCVCVSYCKDLIVGTSFNNRLAWQEKAEYNSIPFKKRVKEIFYSDPGQQIIKVILFCITQSFVFTLWWIIKSVRVFVRPVLSNFN